MEVKLNLWFHNGKNLDFGSGIYVPYILHTWFYWILTTTQQGECYCPHFAHEKTISEVKQPILGHTASK